jgi:hypothetical protein
VWRDFGRETGYTRILLEVEIKQGIKKAEQKSERRRKYEKIIDDQRRREKYWYCLKITKLC